VSKPASRTKSARSKGRSVERPIESTVFPALLSTALTDPLTLIASRVLVIFKSRPSKAAIDSFVGEHRLELDDGGAENVPSPRRYAITRSPTYFFLCTKAGTPISATTIRTMRADSRVHALAPVYQLGSIPGIRGVVALLPQGFMVRLGGEIRIESTSVGEVLASLGLTVHERRSSLLKPFVYLNTPDLAAHAAHVLAPKLVALLARFSPEVVYEMVSFVDVGATAFFDPKDVDYQTPVPGDDEVAGFQWDMKRVGARYAWGITTGDPAVNLMLHDGGVLLSHDVLKYANNSKLKAFSQYDLTALSPDASTPTVVNDHGTQLASVMFGGQNNDELASGMAGHAPSCTFTSLRIEGATANVCAPITNVSIAAAIAYAAGTMRSVLCVGTFAGSAIFNVASVTAALMMYPDVVVVVAAGNMSGDIGYTQPLQPNLLIVGGTFQGTTPINGTAYVADSGDDAWMDPSLYAVGSQTGAALSIVAPGLGTVVGAGSYGTIVASDGSNTQVLPTSTYGTSISSAHVGGIAALVRSKETTFTGVQTVAKILKTAARSGAPNQDAVNRYTTRSSTIYPTGLFSPQMGYGRIDAAAAVRVTDAISTLGSDPDCVYMMARSWPGEDGARPYSGGDPNPFWLNGDVIVSTNGSLLATGPTVAANGTDASFTSMVPALSSTQIQSGVAGGSLMLMDTNYVFVRVVNRSTTASARGVRVSCVLALPSTGLSYPTDYDATGGTTFVVHDDAPSSSYYPGALAPGASYIARFVIPSGTSLASFGTLHMCALIRVTAANDVAFANAAVTNTSNGMVGGGIPLSPTSISNVMQRNLNVV
jgi:hypothetical protein